MRRFPVALQALLAELGWTQTQLAAASGLPLPQVNKYVRGHANVGQEVLEKLTTAFPEPQRARLLCAFLEDAIPEASRHLISISTATHDPLSADQLRSELPKAIQNSLLQLTLLARDRPDVADLIQALIRALTRS